MFGSNQVKVYSKGGAEFVEFTVQRETTSTLRFQTDLVHRVFLTCDL